MAHIQDRGKGVERRWQARYRDGHGQERTKAFSRKVDAEQYLAAQSMALARNEWVDPTAGRVTFAAWWETWQAGRAVRPSTQARDDAYARNHLLPAFGAAQLAAINREDVLALVATMRRKGLAPATIRRAYQLFAMAMQAAVDGERIARTPCRNIELPRIEREPMRFLSAGELAQLADTIDDRFRALVLVLGLGGLRIGEAIALTRPRLLHATRQLDVATTATWVRGHVYVGPPKTRAGSRRVMLPGFVWDELSAHLPRYAADDLVFPSRRDGYLDVSNFRAREWRRAVEAVGLGGLRIHDLRHTAVSLWIAAGADPKAVSVRAGHSSVAFTLDRYGHLYPEADAAIADQLGALYQGAALVDRRTSDDVIDLSERRSS